MVWEGRPENIIGNRFTGCRANPGLSGSDMIKRHPIGAERHQSLCKYSLNININCDRLFHRYKGLFAIRICNHRRYATARRHIRYDYGSFDHYILGK